MPSSLIIYSNLPIHLLIQPVQRDDSIDNTGFDTCMLCLYNYTARLTSAYSLNDIISHFIPDKLILIGTKFASTSTQAPRFTSRISKVCSQWIFSQSAHTTWQILTFCYSKIRLLDCPHMRAYILAFPCHCLSNNCGCGTTRILAHT